MSNAKTYYVYKKLDPKHFSPNYGPVLDSYTMGTKKSAEIWFRSKWGDEEYVLLDREIP